MELTQAIITVFGILIGIPALIGLAVASVYVHGGRQARRAERSGAIGELSTTRD